MIGLLVGLVVGFIGGMHKDKIVGFIKGLVG